MAFSKIDRPHPQFDKMPVSRRSLLKAGLLSPFVFSPLAALLSAGSTATNALAADVSSAQDEDGYRAWLRYEQIDNPALLNGYRAALTGIHIDCPSATGGIIGAELSRGLSAMLSQTISTSHNLADGTLVVANSRSKLLADCADQTEILTTTKALGRDGYLLRSTKMSGKNVILIASETDVGALYGAFALLKILQTHRPLGQLKISDAPKNPLRILAHGDDLDGTIERGYAGASLWKWAELPQKVDDRLKDYARLNASIGINGVVLNKVNATPAILEAKNLAKMAALADLFRPYGLKLFVCANFASPQALGGLKTSDPLDQGVIDWWHAKADEIYKSIPDFGGFLVKANSEDLPGPQDFGRTHADGANMMAGALAPHGGIIMWRAFVYTVGNQNVDRVKRAYIEFQPLDGKFADNVLVQVKNGPLDFQPREPFHPLFGAMPKTRLVAELEITQEYLGQSTHLVYLGTEWEEVFNSNIYGNGQTSGGFTVAQIVEASPDAGSGGLNATSNVGSDRNWCGHHFAQANWYAYGRLAWNSSTRASDIAEQWTRMTWSTTPAVVQCIHDMMMQSHQAYVDYTMPLGLHHMVGGDHYAPLPEGEGDPRGIYHHAALDGIGYDRTRATGSDAVDEYHAPLNDIFNDLSRCPEKYLLWFHHLPWDYRMASGRTLWQELCFRYNSGVQAAEQMEQRWRSLADKIDGQRHREVAAKLHIQATDAKKWADHCLTYFSQYSKLPRS